MKKSMILALGLFCASSSYAEDHQTWDYFDALYASLQAQINTLKQDKHYIGESYHGGVVFWLDEAKEHGLITTHKDINQGQGIQWRNGASGNRVTNAKGDGIGAGEGNTQLIIAGQTNDSQPGTFAALLASSYKVLEDGDTPCPIPVPISVTCYGGWYLPSAHELAFIKTNLGNQGITTFAPDFYWSSTEASATKAWMQNFSSGEQIANDKASTLGQVRAISRF